MSVQLLSNGKTVIELHTGPDSEALASALRSFLSPWFALVPDGARADLMLALEPAAAFPGAWRAACTQPLVIRRSTAAMFNLTVLSGQGEGGLLLAWDPQREVGYAIDRVRRHVTFYGDASRAFIHLIELVRYYVLLIEQSLGTLVLHASAVSGLHDGEVTGIVGAKGAGKTTTMLSLVASGEYHYFSGDKLLLDQVDGVLRVRGWPDYPHIGLGTLRQHPALCERLGVALQADDGMSLPDQHKVLIEPARLLAALGQPARTEGRLKRLVLPQVDPSRRLAHAELSQAEKSEVNIDDLFEWPSRFYTATWHGMEPVRGLGAEEPDPDLVAALRLLPWERRTGTSTVEQENA